jgi:hypothetical protein
MKNLSAGSHGFKLRSIPRRKLQLPKDEHKNFTYAIFVPNRHFGKSITPCPNIFTIRKTSTQLAQLYRNVINMANGSASFSPSNATKMPRNGPQGLSDN